MTAWTEPKRSYSFYAISICSYVYIYFTTLGVQEYVRTPYSFYDKSCFLLYRIKRITGFIVEFGFIFTDRVAGIFFEHRIKMTDTAESERIRDLRNGRFRVH